MNRDKQKSVIFPNTRKSELNARKKSSVRLSRFDRSKSDNRSYSDFGYHNPIKAGERTLQPTYQLYTKTPLLPERIYNIIERTIRAAVAGSAMDRYPEKRTSRFAQSMAHDLMLNVKDEQYERFRVVTWVSIMEKKDQSGMSKLGFCWDAEQDQWSKFVFEHKNLIITAFVCLVYFE